MNQAAGPSQAPGLARLRSVLRVVLGGASIVFVAYAIYELANRWESGKVSLHWGFVALSVLPLLLGVTVLGVGWKWLLERMTARPVPTLPALALHVESQLARYTPGKVGMPLVRMAGAPRLGASANVVGSSVLIELLPFLSVGGATGSLCLWLGSPHASGALALVGRWGVVGLVAFAAITVALIAVDRRHYPAFVLRALGVEGESPLIPRRVPLAHVAYWLTWALHGYFTNRAVGADHASSVAGAGLYVLAPIMGFLALVTPAGVGVREAVLSIGLAPVLSPPPAVAAAIVSRAASLVVDVVAGASGYLLNRRARRTSS